MSEELQNGDFEEIKNLIDNGYTFGDDSFAFIDPFTLLKIDQIIYNTMQRFASKKTSSLVEAADKAYSYTNNYLTEKVDNEYKDVTGETDQVNENILLNYKMYWRKYEFMCCIINRSRHHINQIYSSSTGRRDSQERYTIGYLLAYIWEERFFKPLYQRIASKCLKIIKEHREKHLSNDTESDENSLDSDSENDFLETIKNNSQFKLNNDIYSESFENGFLKEAQEFYSQKQKQISFEPSRMLEYLQRIDKYLKFEENSAKIYMPEGKSTLNNLINKIEDIFILDDILEVIVETMMSFERNPEKREELRRLYESINRMPKIKNKLNALRNVYDRMRRLDKEPELYDLHTHLLGMGNIGFWINTILTNHTILPTNDEFRRDSTLRNQLCRLVWDKKNCRFIHGGAVNKIIQYLIDTNYPNGSLKILKEEIKRALLDAETAFDSLVTEQDSFLRELKDRNLAFQVDFSYDVVLTLDDLAKGLGLCTTTNESSAAIEEKLGFHMASSFNPPRFRYWIVFNARQQKFEVVYGITVEELRDLIDIDANAPRQANLLARAHIVNAFSMCDAHGTSARPIDFHDFRGMFTPKFYPHRFALKDSIYSQRLDILAHLLYYVLRRYDKCHPRVTYCELSVGVGDLTRPWVFDVLCCFPTDLNSESSFRKLLSNEHFPCLKDTVIMETLVPKCTYKFLVGFNRQRVQTSFFNNQKEAIDLLNEAPQIAIHLMLNEINKSARRELVKEDSIFYPYIEELEKVKKMAEKNKSFHDWVVGFDLISDEMGFPYCAFVARNFINYVIGIRDNTNPSFGLRIHFGENVPFADANTPTYRHFIAHMYIAFRCLRYLQQELKYGIRIGHGIAFQRILDGSMSTSKHRKSSVLLAEMQHYALHIFKTIPFEVNITSNEYLLGHALRKGDYQRALRLDALLKLDIPIILATDNDGVWPIDNCLRNCPSHHSLSGEYCRAISSNIIQDIKVLEKMFSNMKKFRFYSKNNEITNSGSETSILPSDTRAFPIIIHPNIIKYIMSLYRKPDQQKGKFYDDFKRVYPSNNNEETNNTPRPDEESKTWELMCRRLAPIAYVAYCAQRSEENSDWMEEIRGTYNTIFGKHPDAQAVFTKWESVFKELINTCTNAERLSIAQNLLATIATEDSRKNPQGSEEIRDASNNTSHAVLEQLECLYQELISTCTVTGRLSVVQNRLAAIFEEKLKEILDQSNRTSGISSNVKHVLKELKILYEKLKNSNTINQSRYVSTNGGKDVFFSEEPFITHNDKTRPMEDLIKYIQDHCHEAICVHAFTRHINVNSTVSKINNVLKNECNPDFHVYIYSNKSKEKYEAFHLSANIQVKINPTSSKRTDSDNVEQQNGLYVICPHASAATAFLQFISEELSNNGNTQLPASEIYVLPECPTQDPHNDDGKQMHTDIGDNINA